MKKSDLECNSGRELSVSGAASALRHALRTPCLLYTSDAADERSSVDLGGRRIIKKKKHEINGVYEIHTWNNDSMREHVTER